MKNRDAQHCTVFPDPDRHQAFILPEELRTKGLRLPRLTLFLMKKLYEASSYRRPMTVREYILYQGTFFRESAYFICPRCDVTMEREYQTYCDRCGQCLGWSRIHQVKRRRIP